GIEEEPDPVLTRKASPVGQRVAAIDTHASISLRENKESKIAFRADGLPPVIPAMRILDKDAAKHMVRLVLMKLDAKGRPHGRGAAIRANDDPCGRAMA